MGSIGVAGSWRGAVTFTSALCLLGLGCLALALPAGASADLSFCPTGSGAGQCDDPSGVAVDFETGALYVAD